MASGFGDAGQHQDRVAQVVEELAPRRWPTSDVAGLTAVAGELTALAARIAEIGETIDRAYRRLPGGSGHAMRAIHDGRDHLLVGSAGVAGVRADLMDAAHRVHRFAEATRETRALMAVLAGIAERDRLRGLVTAAVGDDSVRVIAASAGRLAMGAAAEEYARSSAAAAGEESGAQHRTEESSPASSGALMPMAAGGVLGLGAGALAQGSSDRGSVGAGTASTDRGTEEEPLRRAESDSLIRRAVAVAASLASTGWVSSAVGLATHPSGRRVTVVATSDPVPYLRVGMTMRPDEELAGDGQPPEIAVVSHMLAASMAPLAVASPGRPSAAARTFLSAHEVVSLVAAWAHPT